MVARGHMPSGPCTWFWHGPKIDFDIHVIGTLVMPIKWRIKFTHELFSAQSSGISTIMRVQRNGQSVLQGGADPRREGVVLGDTYQP